MTNATIKVTAGQIDHNYHLWVEGNLVVFSVDDNQYWLSEENYDKLVTLGEWAKEMELWS